MSRSLDDTELLIAEAHNVVILYETADFRHCEINVSLHEHTHLLSKVVVEIFILLGENWLYCIAVADGANTVDMVKVCMSKGAYHRLEIIFKDIVRYSLNLLWIESTAVNDHTFLCLIAYYIAVFLKRIDLEFFDCHNSSPSSALRAPSPQGARGKLAFLAKRDVYYYLFLSLYFILFPSPFGERVARSDG